MNRLMLTKPTQFWR